jgi:two-component system, NarL family, response regulator NreC
MNPIEIVIVEDHLLVRQGLHLILQHEPDFLIVAETGNGIEAVQLVEKWQPAVLLLDLMLPGLNGLEVVRQVKKSSENTQIVILSGYTHEAYILEALKYGANAYVIKESSAIELKNAIYAVLAGQRFFSPPLSIEKIEAYAMKTRGGTLDPYETLTTREREVLHLSAAGNSVPEIAVLLSIGTRTVETHRVNLMRKLNLKTQAELIHYAVRRGLLFDT